MTIPVFRQLRDGRFCCSPCQCKKSRGFVVQEERRCIYKCKLLEGGITNAKGFHRAAERTEWKLKGTTQREGHGARGAIPTTSLP
ncbi:unnamed protein product [Cylicocyclus nassatus]|uniref:Uncharacterized protein n=1 Tax=Cylicocyclus nassatus TaxID=53992 RepID=A0AA36DQ55_CYLNA|nr:unnamed protein product [Cylicocyclus nassatus]